MEDVNFYSPSEPIPTIGNPNDFFIYYQNSKKKRCRSAMIKYCGIFIVLTGMNALSFYIGYILSDSDSSGSLKNYL